MVETTRRMKSGELPPLWAPPSVETGLMGSLARSRSSNIQREAASYVTGQTLVVDGGWTLV